MPHPLIIIVGPTGSGKSALAIKLARTLGGEVVSADARQVYRGLDIGTGKVTKREMRGVPHHCLDLATPRRAISAEQYRREALRAIRGIWKRGEVPLLCGGTGFYVHAITDGTVFPNVKPDEMQRKKLSMLSVKELFRRLHALDPERARTIDLKNPHRLIRAIEVATALGKVPALATRPLDARMLFIGIALPKQDLEHKTKARVRLWLRRGLLAEAKRVLTMRLSEDRLRELGLVYTWAFRLAKKEITREAFIEGLTRDLLGYTKRQMTWFKRDWRIRWISSSREAQQLVRHFLREK